MSDGQTNAAGEVELEQLCTRRCKHPAPVQAARAGAAAQPGSAGSMAGSSGSGGASAGSGAGGASGCTGGTTASSAGSPNASAGTGTAATAGAAQQPIEQPPASSESSSCSITRVASNGSNGAWLALAGAFSVLALTRARRRRDCRAGTR